MFELMSGLFFNWLCPKCFIVHWRAQCSTLINTTLVTETISRDTMGIKTVHEKNDWYSIQLFLVVSDINDKDKHMK